LIPVSNISEVGISDSTVGAWATHWKLPVSSDESVEREIWLWDFGGQADQRLIHQLYMDETALAVLVFAIGLSFWVQYARTVRGSVMVEKNKDYVAAAQLIGLPAPVIMLRHVLPNAMGPILVIATTATAYAEDVLRFHTFEPPGAFGVDIAVGEGQSLGNRLDYGGPSFGFFAARDRFIRRMPGRIAGETVDADGRRGFVLTLQTREQHIRREKATHNICTSQALNAVAGVIYLSWLGRRGIVELGELMLRRTHYAREALGLQPINPGPVVREFAVRLPDLDDLFRRARAERVNPGYRLGRDYPEYADGLLVAITERRTRADIDRLAGLVARSREGVAA